MSPRKATIEVEQLPNGYWRGHLVVTLPALAEPFEQEGRSFHDAGEALSWARGQIELLTLSV